MNSSFEEKRIKIPFHIHPYKFEEGLHAVQKADGEGKQRRYLIGITSGLNSDGHGERMTAKCIAHMEEQAKSGSILMYEGQHAVTHTEDLGILTDSQILPNGDWLTTYRLYDEGDGLNPGGQTLERADKLWKQVNGLPPYVTKDGKPKPVQKGFSIEGYIPDGGILQMNESGQRIIDRVDLDGVLVTPRPSYKDSVVTAIYKALDELPPARRITITEGIRGKFINKIEDENRKQSYYSKRFKLEDALNETIEEIMMNGVQVKDRLDLLFDEYKTMMVNLITSHMGVFNRPPEMQDIPDNSGEVDVAKMQQLHIFKTIESQLHGLLDLRKSKLRTITNSKEYHNGRYGKSRNPRSVKSGRKTHN